jgi:hypothetical protein
MSKIITIDEILGRVQSVRKPHGAVVMDGNHVADTLTCCHCGKMWIPVKGSGKVRGFCTKCNDVTCGLECLGLCIPMEKRLDMYEKGLVGTL